MKKKITVENLMVVKKMSVRQTLLFSATALREETITKKNNKDKKWLDKVKIKGIGGGAVKALPLHLQQLLAVVSVMGNTHVADVTGLGRLTTTSHNQEKSREKGKEKEKEKDGDSKSKDKDKNKNKNKTDDNDEEEWNGEGEGTYVRVRLSILHIILHHRTKHYTTLHYTTLHYTTLHYLDYTRPIVSCLPSYFSSLYSDLLLINT